MCTNLISVGTSIEINSLSTNGDVLKDSKMKHMLTIKKNRRERAKSDVLSNLNIKVDSNVAMNFNFESILNQSKLCYPRRRDSVPMSLESFKADSYQFYNFFHVTIQTLEASKVRSFFQNTFNRAIDSPKEKRQMMEDFLGYQNLSILNFDGGKEFVNTNRFEEDLVERFVQGEIFLSEIIEQEIICIYDRLQRWFENKLPEINIHKSTHDQAEEIRDIFNQQTTISLCSKKNSLDFSHLMLKGFVPELSWLFPNALEINLNGNNLVALDGWITHFDKLETLLANDNKIEAISLGKETCKIHRLCLRNNKLRKIPDGLLQCNNLVYLDMAHNPLKNLPDDIYLLNNLIELDVTDCMLNEIPKSVGKISSLKKLHLDDNNVASLPDNLIDRMNAERPLEVNYLNTPMDPDVHTISEKVPLFNSSERTNSKTFWNQICGCLVCDCNN
jgi:hypothetical protein